MEQGQGVFANAGLQRFQRSDAIILSHIIHPCNDVDLPERIHTNNSPAHRSTGEFGDWTVD
jgi:hypothetical protein